MQQSPRVVMGGTVVIKWGGGLITQKDKLCTVKQDVIDSLSEVCQKSEKNASGICLGFFELVLGAMLASKKH